MTGEKELSMASKMVILKQGDNFHLVSEQEVLGQDRKLHHSFYEKNSREKLFVKGRD